jgi:hypothetical protein
MNRYYTVLVFFIQLLVVVIVVRRVWNRATELKNRPSPADGLKQDKSQKRAGEAEVIGTRETLLESLAKHRRQMEEELARFMRQQQSINK